MEEFIVKFAEIFDDIDVSALSADTEFRGLDDWESMVALSDIAVTDEEYGVTLNADDRSGSCTIGDIFKAIESKR